MRLEVGDLRQILPPHRITAPVFIHLPKPGVIDRTSKRIVFEELLLG